MKLHPSTARILLTILTLTLPPGLCLAGSDAADAGWTLRDEGETHALYTRGRAGSDYDEYRMEVGFEAKPDAVLAALQHNMVDPDALPATMRRTVLRRDGDVLVSHDYIDVPFLADRDAVMRTEFERDVEPGVHIVRWRSIEGEGPEPADGVVRMPNSTGSWTLAPGASGGTHAIYESHVDLGGSLPSSLVDSQTTREIVQQVHVIRRTVRERELAQR